MAGWLNGVVEARRKVLVPLERGLLQTLALAKEHGCTVTMHLVGSVHVHGPATSRCDAVFADPLVLVPRDVTRNDDGRIQAPSRGGEWHRNDVGG